MRDIQSQVFVKFDQEWTIAVKLVFKRNLNRRVLTRYLQAKAVQLSVKRFIAVSAVELPAVHSEKAVMHEFYLCFRAKFTGIRLILYVLNIFSIREISLFTSQIVIE